ncbi:MAG TPA: ABC transporter substrate-binding protein [Verrucomicrobiales bacterium]|nr:ABC transporter substrate-binding protein [Verrucomicrobiales bacterium]
MLKFRSNFLVISICLVCLGALALGASEPLRVFVSISPQKFFVEKIGQDLIDVEVLLGPNSNPTTFQPSISQLKRFAKSRYYFRIGLPFETGFIHKIRNQPSLPEIVNTQKGMELKEISHSHHSHNDHNSNERPTPGPHPSFFPDPHTWLDPNLVKIQAETIFEKLVSALPEKRSELERRLMNFKNDLETTDKEIKKILELAKGKTLFVFHPSFGYFSDAYGLNQLALETDGRQPSPRQLRAFMTQARQQKVSTMFVQSRFNRRTAEIAAKAMNLKLERLDPLAEDYLLNLKKMAILIASRI